MISSMERWYWIASVVPAIAALYYLVQLLVLFKHLPMQTPIHFGFDGSPNGWLNRYAWAAVSIVMVGVMLGVVFATRPITGEGAAAGWMYWIASGLVMGAFIQVNRAAAGRHNLHLWPLAVWSFAVPLLEFGLVKAVGPWLKG